MSSIKKTFDAVDMMRRIRDELSANIKGMTLEEELEWLASQDLKDPFLERQRQKAAQHAATDERRVAIAVFRTLNLAPFAVERGAVSQTRTCEAS